MLLRILAGLVAIPAGFFAVVLTLGGIWLFLAFDGGALALLVAALGGVALPGVRRLLRVMSGADTRASIGSWLAPLVLTGVPVYFAYGYVHYYDTELPMKHARGAMRSALQSVAEAQRDHLAATGSYAVDVASLDTLEAMASWRSAPEVLLQITQADSAGWAARAEHSKVTSVCTIAGTRADPIPMSECTEGKLRRR